MPHATSMPAPGFQAIILCGPGVSFDTFTSKPEESPKALIPIANRPMVWYPLDFCYRMGITNITLITPPASAVAIAAALRTNPHLTSLPLPKPDLLAPEGLKETTGTAQIFRLPEVRAVIKGDFVVLPCDLVCELGGEALIQTWMIKEASLGGAIGGDEGFEGVHMALGGEREGRRGGLGVWYDTDEEISVKGEETDFIGITKIQHGAVPPAKDSLLSKTSNLVYAMPTDTLFDIVDSKKSLPIRHALIQKHGNVRMLTGHRDAHLYIFPSWVLDMINANEEMDNLSEDVIGWWAKADWQEGFAEKLGLRAIFHEDSKSGRQNDLLDNDVDIGNLSSTWTTSNSRSEELNSTSFNTSVDGQTTANPNFTGAKEQLPVPPILAYIHNSAPAGPLIRRVDTAPLLLLISLQLAKLDSLDSTSTPSPFAHLAKVAYPAGIAARCTVTRPDCLLAENVTVEEKCAIKECVIGANCQIGAGAKLTKCVLMDGVIVGKGCKITSSILGRRVNVGDDSVLVDVEVEDNLKLEPGTESKSEKFKSSAGLEATEDEFRDAFEESDEDGTPEQSIDF